jgi:hypothetical protein
MFLDNLPRGGSKCTHKCIAYNIRKGLKQIAVLAAFVVYANMWVVMRAHETLRSVFVLAALLWAVCYFSHSSAN